jgi:hypothetical protein
VNEFEQIGSYTLGMYNFWIGKNEESDLHFQFTVKDDSDDLIATGCDLSVEDLDKLAAMFVDAANTARNS